MYRLLISFLAAVVWCMVFPGRPGRAAPLDEDKYDEYKEIIKKAIVEFEAQRWDEARSFFEEAHAINPNARTLRGIGLTAYKARDYVTAIRALEASLQETRRPLDERMRVQVAESLRASRKFVAYYIISIVPEEVSYELSIDGNPIALSDDGAVQLNPGEHELVVAAKGYRDVTRLIVAVSGKRRNINISLLPIQNVRPLETDDTEPVEGDGALYSTLAWSCGSGSLLSLGGAITAWVIRDSKIKGLESDRECITYGLDAQSCQDKVDTVHQIETWAIVGFSLAGLLAATSAVFFVLDSSEPSGDRRRGARCGSGPGELGVSCNLWF